jgi:hypothetical protein
MTLERTAQPQAHPKKRYTPPKLVELGKVSDLTAGVKGSGGDIIRKRNA